MMTNNAPSDEISAMKAGRKPNMINNLKAVTLLLIAGLTSGGVLGSNSLTDVSYANVADGTTEIILSFAAPPAAPAAFVTESPPRIALDFADTRNVLTERRINIGSGATSAVSAVEAGGKTRIVIELYRKAEYTLRQEGSNLVIAVADGEPASRTSTISSTQATSQPGVNVLASLTNVDFRRGPNGEGRVLINFSKDSVGTDLRKEGNKIIVDIFDVSVTETLPKRLDVTDFATPVSFIEINERAGGARMEIATTGQVEHMAYQTGTDFIVEITEVREKTEVRRGVGDVPVYTGTPLTFNFQDIPVRSVLQLIADVSELNVVVADSVQGSVTTRLVNVPWDQALDIVLQAKGLDKRRQGDVIWIAPVAEIAAREQALEDARNALEDRQPLVSEYISINYGKAKDIASLLTADAKKSSAGGGSGAAKTDSNAGFLSPRGSVSFDDRTNTLLVNDIAPKIKELKELIKLLDRPVDQVLIEARVVIANESFAKELGARFGVSGAYEDSDGNVIGQTGRISGADNIINEALRNRQNGSGSGLPVGVTDQPGEGVLVPSLSDRLAVNLPVASPAGSIGWAILGANYILDLELSALETEGRGEVVSNPKVITTNQHEAIIKQGSQFPYKITTSQQGTATESVQFIDVVLSLRVTPTITQDDRVFLDVKINKDQVQEIVATNSGGVPVIGTRQVETAALVENGQTVVLGGVYEFTSREDLTKVPFLGNLPGIGNLFKKKGNSREKAELLIFITPKILRQRGKSS